MIDVTELEEAKLKIEYLNEEIAQLELRLENAMAYIGILLEEMKNVRTR